MICSPQIGWLRLALSGLSVSRNGWPLSSTIVNDASWIDGSSVLVHMPPEGDYNSRAAADGLLKGIHKYPERDLDTALLVYGAGDGGGGPGEIHLELLARERDLAGLPKIEFSTADQGRRPA